MQITTLCAVLHHSKHVRRTSWSTMTRRKAAMDPEFPMTLRISPVQIMPGALLAIDASFAPLFFGML